MDKRILHMKKCAILCACDVIVLVVVSIILRACFFVKHYPAWSHFMISLHILSISLLFTNAESMNMIRDDTFVFYIWRIRVHDFYNALLHHKNHSIPE